MTRGRKEEGKSPLDVLFEILKDKTIKGSTNSGYISGSDPAVCFQDAPLNGIAQNIRPLIRSNSCFKDVKTASFSFMNYPSFTNNNLNIITQRMIMT
jgi:hypothetical protein